MVYGRERKRFHTTMGERERNKVLNLYKETSFQTTFHVPLKPHSSFLVVVGLIRTFIRKNALIKARLGKERSNVVFLPQEHGFSETFSLSPFKGWALGQKVKL